MTRGVSPLELTSAYGTFANRGVHVDPVAIIRVVSRTGKVLEEAERKEKSVISAANASTMSAMLEDVIQRGTGTSANIGRPAAGKTGTTSDYHDAWFVGYTPDLVAGVWIGNDSVGDLKGMSGGMTPAVIWQAFMLRAHAGLPVRHFEGTSSYPVSSDAEDSNETPEKENDGKSSSEEKGKDTGKTSGTSSAGKHRPNRSAAQASHVPSPGASDTPEPGMGVEKGQN